MHRVDHRGPSAEDRSALRATVAYMRAIRRVAEAIAADHAAWSRFVSASTGALRVSGQMWRPNDVRIAETHAQEFRRHRAQLNALDPPPLCASVHKIAGQWVEALDLLASMFAPAIEHRKLDQMVAVLRESGEAVARLKAFKLSYHETVQAIRVKFRLRPRAPGAEVANRRRSANGAPPSGPGRPPVRPTHLAPRPTTRHR